MENIMEVLLLVIIAITLLVIQWKLTVIAKIANTTNRILALQADVFSRIGNLTPQEKQALCDKYEIPWDEETD